MFLPSTIGVEDLSHGLFTTILILLSYVASRLVVRRKHTQSFEV